MLRPGADNLLELLEWMGTVNPCPADRLRFLEGAFLCGFQAAQRAAGVKATSRNFAVDAGIELKRTAGGTNGKIAGWLVSCKGGSEYLPHKRLVRRPRKR